MKKIEVISLIYKSKTYLDFICDQFKKDYHCVPGYTVDFRLVANDPWPAVLDNLSTCGIKYDIYNDKNPNEYYLNRVYRCWNFAGMSSSADIICFVNSDMAFSKGWLENLVKYHHSKSIVTSRLVESGRMPSGKHGYAKEFGRDPLSFDENAWLNHVDEASENKSEPGGLFMPVLFDKDIFVASGGYPEGNIYTGGVGASNTKYLKSGDDFFFNKTLKEKFNMTHITAFDSMVYHFQSGEMLE